MSMLRVPGGNDGDAVLRLAVPRPRRPLAGRPDETGPAEAIQSAGSPRSAGRPRSSDGGLRVRQLSVREVHVRELRTGPRHEYQLAARQLQSRQAGPVTATRTQARSVTATRTQARSVTAVRTRAAGNQAAPVSAARRAPGPAAPGRVRLTRRGRRVLAGFAIVVALAAISVFWISAAGGAQAASHHSAAGSAYSGLTRVVVRPGQTLWSIAARAEPTADPRSVIAQIMEVNAISSPDVQPGELLWVPQG
jgi:nucleoid-associated protein YgaU